MVAATPKILSPLRDKDPSDKHNRMAKWIKQNGGGDIDPKAIQIVLRADGLFQKSDENQAQLARRKEEIELERQAREERAAQRAERAEAREAAKAEKAEKAKASPKASTPPVKKAAPAKKTPAAKAPATKAPTKAPASKATAKPAPKRPAKAAAKAENFDSDDF
jgi:hypothetical protein